MKRLDEKLRRYQRVGMSVSHEASTVKQKYKIQDNSTNSYVNLLANAAANVLIS